jgi:hypothetical protein
VNTRSRLVAVLALLIVTLGLATVARALTPAVAIDPASGPPLTTIKVSGSSFCPPPCSPVSILVDNVHVDDNVAVGADGSFSTFVQVPGGTSAGPTPVAATQTDAEGNPASAQTDFNVTPNQPAPVQYPPPSSVQPPSGGPSTTAATVPTTDQPTTTEASSQSSPSASSSPTTTSSSASSSPGSSQVAAATGSSTGSSGSNTGLIVGLVVAALAIAVGVGLWTARRRASSSTP